MDDAELAVRDRDRFVCVLASKTVPEKVPTTSAPGSPKVVTVTVHEATVIPGLPSAKAPS